VRRLALLLLGVASWSSCRSPSQTAQPPAPVFERPVEVVEPGIVGVRLDRHVYEAARSDLGDLRILDRGGDDVPYVLDRGRGPQRPEVRPRMRNRGHQADGSATVVLDFGERIDKDRLVLRLTGRNFRRRVTVEGSDDGETWTTLADDAWVFAVPEPDVARYEDVSLPVNDHPLLRVTVEPGARERMPVEILEAWVPAGGTGPRREETLSPSWSRAAEARPGESWLVLDLGARYQPFEALVLRVQDERFFREVRTEVRRDVEAPHLDMPAPPARWDPLGSDVIYRFEQGGVEREKLRVDVRGRARALRVRVLNGDDRPLVYEDVAVRVPVERLLFQARTGGGEEYRLTYGAPGLAAPHYDLARTLDAAMDAPWAGLGPPIRLGVEADVLPWTERHPVLLWVGLLLVVSALGGVTWRAIRSV
jgi:hypothetical protein